MDRKKVVGGDEAAFEYRWGSRAEKELTKREVLQFVSEVRLDYFLFIVVELILEGFSRDPWFDQKTKRDSPKRGHGKKTIFGKAMKRDALTSCEKVAGMRDQDPL